MGVATSNLPKDGTAVAPASGKDGSLDDMELMVTINAKTKCNRTRTVKTKKVVFKAGPGAGTSIGQAAESCDVVIDDSYLSAQHINITINPEGKVMLTPLARTCVAAPCVCACVLRSLSDTPVSLAQVLAHRARHEDHWPPQACERPGSQDGCAELGSDRHLQPSA